MLVLPQSNALAEAGAESISDLMSKDPESYTKQNFERMISLFRVARETWNTVAESGKKPKAEKLGKGTGLLKQVANSAEMTEEDLGF